MTLDTIFDMASLTKCLATATAVMQLYQEGKLSPNDPVAKYLPDFAANGKEDITIRDLLTHYSGLPPDLDLLEPWAGKEEGYRRAFAAVPMRPPGERFVYSDINFIVLGALVEKLSGLTLDQYTQKNIMAPMGLTHTRYLPPASWIPDIAPTQWEHGASASGNPASKTFPGDTMLRGVVHDPTSRRMGGVAGHAGLFSTADDVAIYAQNLLDRLAGRPSSFPLSRIVLAEDGGAGAARHRHLPARLWMGHRFSLFQQSRHAVSRGFVRPHRFHRHLALDGSHQRHLRCHPRQLRSS